MMAHAPSRQDTPPSDKSSGVTLYENGEQRFTDRPASALGVGTTGSEGAGSMGRFGGVDSGVTCSAGVNGVGGVGVLSSGVGGVSSISDALSMGGVRGDVGGVCCVGGVSCVGGVGGLDGGAGGTFGACSGDELTFGADDLLALLAGKTRPRAGAYTRRDAARGATRSADAHLLFWGVSRHPTFPCTRSLVAFSGVSRHPVSTSHTPPPVRVLAGSPRPLCSGKSISGCGCFLASPTSCAGDCPSYCAGTTFKRARHRACRGTRCW